MISAVSQQKVRSYFSYDFSERFSNQFFICCLLWTTCSLFQRLPLSCIPIKNIAFVLGLFFKDRTLFSRIITRLELTFQNLYCTKHGERQQKRAQNQKVQTYIIIRISHSVSGSRVNKYIAIRAYFQKEVHKQAQFANENFFEKSSLTQCWFKTVAL